MAQVTFFTGGHFGNFDTPELKAVLSALKAEEGNVRIRRVGVIDFETLETMAATTLVPDARAVFAYDGTQHFGEAYVRESDGNTVHFSFGDSLTGTEGVKRALPSALREAYGLGEPKKTVTLGELEAASKTALPPQTHRSGPYLIF